MYNDKAKRDIGENLCQKAEANQEIIFYLSCILLLPRKQEYYSYYSYFIIAKKAGMDLRMI